MRALLFAAALVAGCKKKPPEEVIPPLPDASVDARLTLVSVSPSRIDPDAPTTVRAFGAGFARGMTVTIGETPAMSVNWVSENQVELVLPSLAAGSWDVRVTNPDASSDTLRSGLLVGAETGDGAACDFVVLYFETDADGLTPAAQSTLGGLVPCYQGASGTVSVTGHADERGTVDYNVALSYRRALSVRDYLVGAGVPAARLPVTSYGEEKPAEPGAGPAAWARNRRVELAFD